MASKQETYRRLMRQEKSKSGVVHRIDSPLAKYNSVGQLSCMICSLAIKSEILWQTHLQSKRHKEGVAALKAKKNQTKYHSVSLSDSKKQDQFSKQSHTRATKRSLTEASPTITAKAEGTQSKKSRVVQNKEEMNVGESPPADTSNISVPSGSQLPSDFFDSDMSKGGNGGVTNKGQEMDFIGSGSTTNNLPADFFDKPRPEEKEEDNKNKETIGKERHSDLPEGFFDDPKVDAKVRKVEYKNPQEQMWEEFQKSIQKETQVSEAIVEGEDEEMKEDRELAEVNEQVACFERAERLREKQEMLVVQKDKNLVLMVGTDGTSLTCVKQEEELLDDVDFDDLLNWRSKTSL